jgi:hypothetical protein
MTFNIEKFRWDGGRVYTGFTDINGTEICLDDTIMVGSSVLLYRVIYDNGSFLIRRHGGYTIPLQMSGGSRERIVVKEI